METPETPQKEEKKSIHSKISMFENIATKEQDEKKRGRIFGRSSSRRNEKLPKSEEPKSDVQSLLDIKKKSVRSLINKHKIEQEKAKEIQTSARKAGDAPARKPGKFSSVANRISMFNNLGKEKVTEGAIGKSENIAGLPLECIDNEAIKGLKCLTNTSKKPDCSSNILTKVILCLNQVKGKLEFATHAAFKGIDMSNLGKLNAAGA